MQHQTPLRIGGFPAIQMGWVNCFIPSMLDITERENLV